jgi:tRNA(Ile)-lysidine synthase
MRKLSPIAYRSLFFKHVWRFLQNVATPHELQGDHVIAVSGGLDSMALLWFANVLHKQGKIGLVRAVFIHHHTRSGQKGDGDLVKKFCLQEDIPYKILHAKGLTPTGNFEAKARKVRRELALGDLKKNEILWVGHHLDDSFEWHLMQRWRSTNPKSTLGVPVRNHHLIRPFLCVTRAQIKKLVTFEGIPYRDDPTNWDTKYDRNYVRHEIVPKIAERFPQYLKHYAYTSNYAATGLKLSILTKGGPAQIYSYENGAILIGKHFNEIQIQEVIHSYSNVDRGELITPIQRMLKAIENGKKGPFQFSGGVDAYSTHGLLMIYCRNVKNYDRNIAGVLNSISTFELTQLPSYKRVELEHSWKNLLNSPDAMGNMPGLVLILESDNVCKTLNCSVFDPLFPEISQVCKERGFRFTTMLKCIETWKVKKEKLPEKLRILPLSNLSNLFSSHQ